MQYTDNEIVDMLKGVNKKDIERVTGIPADRIYKWVQGKGMPKTEDRNKLLKYFGINSETPTGANDLSQESNIAYKASKENNNFRLNDSEERGSFYKALPNKQQNDTTDMPPDILKWVDPNHAPIPVYDLTDGITSISELLRNDSYKPTVILLKGHLGCNAVVRHVDKGMLNEDFKPRCQLGIQRLFDFKERIIPGMAAIVVLKELVVTRFVFNAEAPDNFLLRSTHVERFPDMIIPKDEIREMWKIKSSTPIPDITLF